MRALGVELATLMPNCDGSLVTAATTAVRHFWASLALIACFVLPAPLLVAARCLIDVLARHPNAPRRRRWAAQRARLWTDGWAVLLLPQIAEGCVSLLSCVAIDGAPVLRFDMAERCDTTRHAAATAAAAMIVLGYAAWLWTVLRAVLLVPDPAALLQRFGFVVHMRVDGEERAAASAPTAIGWLVLVLALSRALGGMVVMLDSPYVRCIPPAAALVALGWFGGRHMAPNGLERGIVGASIGLCVLIVPLSLVDSWGQGWAKALVVVLSAVIGSLIRMIAALNPTAGQNHTFFNT